MTSKSKRYCSVPQCNNYCTKEISLHYFPKNKVLKKKWQIALKIGKDISPYMNVCSEHFMPCDFYPRFNTNRKVLKLGSIPSRKLPTRKFDVVKKPRKITERRNVKENEIPELECVEEIPMNEVNVIEPEKSDDNISVKELNVVVKSTQNKECQVAFEETMLDKIYKDDKNFIYFTGISKKVFLSLENCLEEISDALKISRTLNRVKLLIVLFKLKTNNTFRVMGTIFNIPFTTVRRYFRETLKILSAIFKRLIFIPDREQHLVNIPKCFEKFKNVRVVLDCTEIDIQKSNCLNCRIKTYSNYKKRHTLKFLIGVTPAGMICFVSSAYGGKTSDKAIVKNEKFLDLLEPYRDAVMVDKGFLIEDECLNYGIKLIRPPFLRQKKQFSKAEATATADIARARVHVERAIQRIKNFKIVSSKLDFMFVPYADDIMFIICALVNLSAPILSDEKF